MKEIEILYEMPIIFTKDIEAAKRLSQRPEKPGTIIILPEDAILCVSPQINSIIDSKI